MLSNIIKAHVKKHIIMWLLLLVIIISSVAFALLPPQILRIIIDNTETIYTSGQQMVLAVAVIYLVSVCLNSLLEFLKQVVLADIGEQITADIRIVMSNKLSRLPARFFTKHETGTITSYFTSDVDAINTIFTDGIISMFVDVLKIIGIMISLFLFSFELGVCILICIPLIYWYTEQFRKAMFQSELKSRKAVGATNNHISETLMNFLMIKVFHKEAYMESCYDTYLKENYDAREHVNFYDSIYSPTIQIITALLISLVVLMSGNHLLLELTTGMVAGTIAFISELFAPIESLGMELQSIQKAAGGAKRVETYLQAEEDEERTAEIKDMTSIEIQFHDVSFAYEEEHYLLDEYSLSIHNGDKITIMGRTGAGKSTMMKLLSGVLKPQKGCVTINGIDVFSLMDTCKAHLFGYVEQNYTFIDGTIRDNITLFDDIITDEEIWQVLEKVQLADTIRQLPNGLDTPYKDAVLSQGQKQLLSIAQSCIYDPPVLLLDEISANLDADTERRVMDVLRNVGKDKTIISISHRTNEMFSDTTIVRL